MSSPPNSWSEPDLLPVPEPPAPVVDVPSENPPWSGWDVLLIVFLTFISGVVVLPVVGLAAQRLFYPNVAFLKVITYPLVGLLVQGLAYLLTFAFMPLLVKREPGRDFWHAIRWNWPKNWMAFLLAGVALLFSLQAMMRFLPIPKVLPMDQFFQTSAEAWTMLVLSVIFAPLFEELLFRGFLYPVLARRLGVVTAVLVTAASFSLVHAPQLGRAWGPVLAIFIVGLALTITRAVTKSVAASLIMHMAYNATISVLLLVGSGGFRHLERLNQ